MGWKKGVPRKSEAAMGPVVVATTTIDVEGRPIHLRLEPENAVLLKKDGAIIARVTHARKGEREQLVVEPVGAVTVAREWNPE